jgi:hypothetical protein
MGIPFVEDALEFVSEFPVVGDLIGGALGYVGTKEMNEANIAIAREQMAFEGEQADINRDWQNQQRIYQQNFQQMMSNTAVQRRMADLKKAGINPILAGRFDASSPAGAMGSGAQGRSPGLAPQANKLQNAIMAANSAADIRLKHANAEKIKEETKYVGNKVNMSELLATIMPMMAGWIGQVNSSAGNISNMPKRLADAYKASEEAKKIRKEPGIELTEHTKKRLRQKEYTDNKRKSHQHRKKNRRN